MFTWTYKDLKNIPPKLVQHIIELNTSIPPTHQTRYSLNPNYATTIKQDIDKLLAIGFIQPLKEATWLSPIMVLLKKNGKLRICVNFKKLNKATKKNPYPLPFSDELVNIVIGYETYSFLDGYSRYHQISIAREDRYKTSFIIDWGAFVWMVIPFNVKNGPPTFQIPISKTFKKYLNQFMKIFLDDFMVYNDMDSHLMKLIFYFKKCKEYKIGLNPKKCAFMVFSGLILGFIVSKEGKIPNPKKV